MNVSLIYIFILLINVYFLDVKFDVILPNEEYELPLLDNQQLISIPKPNILSNYSQLLLSVDNDYQLQLWQFTNGDIVPLNKYSLQLKTNFDAQDNQLIKLKSFIVKTAMNSYRLFAILLIRQNGQNIDSLLILAINFVLQGSYVILQTNFNDQQIILFERIPDFDIISISKHRIYLSIIHNSKDSNYKYELSLYKLQNVNIFDKIAEHRSDYIYHANHIKLAFLDNGLYLICSYDTISADYSLFDNGFYHGHQAILSIFQLIENNNLIFISSVNNVTTSPIQSIQHLSGNNEFFFLVKEEDIDVYWWDGHSLIYYDVISNHESLSFALEKLPDQPPLILSTDGRTLNLFYKVYSKFIHHRLDLAVDNQHRLVHVEIFTFNGQYFVWLKFSAGTYHVSIKNYCKFARVQSKKPESNEEMHNLDTCLMDLKERLDRGIKEIKTLKTKSENLLVITHDNPYIDVDVIVNDTLKTKRTEPESFSIKIPGLNLLAL